MTSYARELERDPVDVLEQWADRNGHLISYIKIGKSPCTVEVRRQNCGESFRASGATFDDATQNAACAALRGWAGVKMEPRLGEAEAVGLVKEFARQSNWPFSQVTYTHDGHAYTCTYRVGDHADGHVVQGDGIGASERVARQAAVRVLLAQLGTTAPGQAEHRPLRPAGLVAQ